MRNWWVWAVVGGVALLVFSKKEGNIQTRYYRKSGGIWGVVETSKNSDLNAAFSEASVKTIRGDVVALIKDGPDYYAVADGKRVPSDPVLKVLGI